LRFISSIAPKTRHARCFVFRKNNSDTRLTDKSQTGTEVKELFQTVELARKSKFILLYLIQKKNYKKGGLHSLNYFHFLQLERRPEQN